MAKTHNTIGLANSSSVFHSFLRHCCYIAGSDYTAAFGLQITLDAATRSIPVDVSLMNDTVFELTESFSSVLSLPGGPINRVTLAPDSAVAEILDEDGQLFRVSAWTSNIIH